MQIDRAASRRPGRALHPALAALAVTMSLAWPGGASIAQPARPAVPQTCAPLTGVERKICVECANEAAFRRLGCEQRVFWTTCRGKRLFDDPFCRAHQDRGPPPSP